VQEKFQRKDQHGLLNLLTLTSPVDLIQKNLDNAKIEGFRKLIDIGLVIIFLLSCNSGYQCAADNPNYCQIFVTQISEWIIVVCFSLLMRTRFYKYGYLCVFGYFCTHAITVNLAINDSYSWVSLDKSQHKVFETMI
jgi:hypothetical protein